MKFSKTILALSIAAALFTSCEKEDVLEINNPQSEAAQNLPALPSTIDNANKGNNNFFTPLQTLKQLKGSWKLNYIYNNGQWNTVSEYGGVDLSFFAGSYYYGQQILAFDDSEVELFREKIVFANGNEYPRVSAGSLSFEKTTNGLSIDKWNYRAYTCWDGKGIMIIPIIDQNDNSLSRYPAKPHFFIKE